MQPHSGFGRPSQMLLGVLLVLATMLGQAQSLTLSNPYHFRHTDSRFAHSDRHYVGVTAAPDAGGGATVTAAQGAAQLPLADIGHGEFFASTPYAAALAGPWRLDARHDGQTAQATTNAIDGVGPMPFVRNLTSTGGLPTPTLTWELPGGPEPFTRTRIRFYDGWTGAQLGGTFAVGLDTRFTVPAGLLAPQGRYGVRVMLENVQAEVLVNRSSTYTYLPLQGIGGQVLQVDGITPIGGATVEALGVSPGTPFLTPTTTAATGGYHLALPAGHYRVRARAPGYARKYFDNVTPSHEATVLYVADGANLAADFTLNEGGSIIGYIYQSDGVTPIVNASVFVRPGNYFSDDGFRTHTAPDGSYAVDSLALGQYKITADSAGYANQKYYGGNYGWNNATNVNVFPPNSTNNIDINLDLGGSISGYVYATDGVTPLNNVGILADPLPGGTIEGIGTRSGVDGSYTITGLPPLSYIVRVPDDSLPGWLVGEFYDSKNTGQEANIITVAPSQNILGINFMLDEGGIITGQVFDDETKQPVSGVGLHAFTIAGGYQAGLGNTNFEGKYQLRYKAGQYFVQAYAPSGYIPVWYQNAFDRNDATPIEVVLRQVTTGINLYLTRPGSISGQVFEIDGVTPIAGANVFAFPVDPQWSGSGANTGPDGGYQIQGLATGDYVAQVTVTGHVSANQPVAVVSPAETPDINFALDTYPFTVKIIGQGVVGQAGGGVVVTDTASPLRNAGVDLPAGALSDYRVINIGEVNAPALPPQLVGIGAPVHFGPEGLMFAKPVTLKIPYQPEDLANAGISDPRQLHVYLFDLTHSTWRLVSGPKTVDPVNHLITIAVQHFSLFRLAAPSSDNLLFRDDFETAR